MSKNFLIFPIQIQLFFDDCSFTQTDCFFGKIEADPRAPAKAPQELVFCVRSWLNGHFSVCIKFYSLKSLPSQGNVTSSQASPTRTRNDFDLVLVNLNHCFQPSY